MPVLSEPAALETGAGGRRARLALWAVGFFGSRLIVLLGRTWRLREVVPDAVRDRVAAGQGIIYAFWHGRLLPLVFTHRRRGIVVLVSLHRDGEYIARTIEALGFGTVRGSTTRGGARALAALLARARGGASFGITPDGPRGPRHVLQPGVITLASRSGLPIVLLATSGRPAWQARSWDRFFVPLPFARCVVLSSEPIFVPRELDEAGFERWRADVEDRLRRLVEEADRPAGHGAPAGGSAHRVALAAYRAGAGLAAIVAVPYLAWRALGHGREIRERLAIGGPRAEGRPAWLHGASVGEARGIIAVARALEARAAEVVATAVTPAGVESLRRAGMRAFFAPLDLPSVPERALGRIRPRLLVVFETELWPGLWSAARARGVPVAVANARLTEGALRRYRALAAVVRPLARGAALVAAQSEADAARWIRLGADPAVVLVTGSTKHDASVDAAGGEAVRLRLPGRRIFVAGSTRPGEEEILLEAWGRAGPPEDWLLVLAPRHANRFEEVAAMLERGPARWRRWSRPGKLDDAAAVLLDTLGELNAFYAAADLAFVGGSLLPFGGHNVLEPAAAGLPVLFGPHTENAGETPERLLEAGGAVLVRDAAEAAGALERLVADDRERQGRGEAARAVAACEMGATGRLIEALVRRGLL